MKFLRLSSSTKDLKSFNLWQSLVAEFIGTFALVFVGYGSAYNNVNPVKLGLGFGFAGAVAIYCVGPISGGHINPAVSFGLLIARQISLIRFLLYSIVQTIGATAGFGFIMLVTNGNVLDKSILSINVTKIPNLKNITSVNMVEIIHRIDPSHLKVLCELVITFTLVFTVMRMCVEKSRSPSEQGLAPFIIGLSITMGVYCGMNISGGSMNPAASLGKYFCSRSKGVWTHIVGPLAGAALAGLLQQLVFTSELSGKHVRNYLFSSNFGNDDKNEKKSKKSEHPLNENI